MYMYIMSIYRTEDGQISCRRRFDFPSPLRQQLLVVWRCLAAPCILHDFLSRGAWCVCHQQCCGFEIHLENRTINLQTHVLANDTGHEIETAAQTSFLPPPPRSLPTNSSTHPHTLSMISWGSQDVALLTESHSPLCKTVSGTAVAVKFDCITAISPNYTTPCRPDPCTFIEPTDYPSHLPSPPSSVVQLADIDNFLPSAFFPPPPPPTPAIPRAAAAHVPEGERSTARNKRRDTIREREKRGGILVKRGSHVIEEHGRERERESKTGDGGTTAIQRMGKGIMDGVEEDSNSKGNEGGHTGSVPVSVPNLNSRAFRCCCALFWCVMVGNDSVVSGGLDQCGKRRC